mmetsp:Transcript_41174/g.99195  ORF Transcript_41174/g.99195 Transcript_41174/m.99195 type:complete len:345 (-) Transcript_41174:1502-2536(-)
MFYPKQRFIAILVLTWIGASTHAWVLPPVVPQTHRSQTSSTVSQQSSNHRISSTSLNGWLDGLSPGESKIPEELKDEIYRAEANTPAAKERGQRVAFLALVSFTGILCAFFNGFLTELRAAGPDGSPGVNLADSSFDWVVSNPVTSFLFTNAIGGGLCLLLGAGAGLLAEAELDSKRINAEKIYEELERRRNERTTPSAASKKKKKMEKAKKKRRSGKEQKRLGALSEVVAVESTTEGEEAATTLESDVASGADPIAAVSEKDDTDELESSDKGLLGGIKDLYKKADTMAASQALLLNKQLEEVGVVDKITDDTGLKVIGKEAADKLGKEKSEGVQREKEAEKQ